MAGHNLFGKTSSMFYTANAGFNKLIQAYSHWGFLKRKKN